MRFMLYPICTTGSNRDVPVKACSRACSQEYPSTARIGLYSPKQVKIFPGRPQQIEIGQLHTSPLIALYNIA